MGNNAAENLSRVAAEEWSKKSDYELEQAKAVLGMGNITVQEFRKLMENGGLSEDTLNRISELDAFKLNNVSNYNPAIGTATNIASGNTVPQQQLATAANQWNGWALNPLNSSPGMNSPLQGLQDRGTDITNTQGQAGLSELVDAQKTYGDVISEGGMTPDLKALSSLGRSMVASGGFTPELMGFLQNASSQIMQYGEMTPEMRSVFNSAMEIVNAGGEGGALLPTEQIISFARDEATARGQDQFAAAQRSAIQRGMTPGAVTGVGGNFAEFADEIGQGEAKALRDASLGAQEQRLQQFLASQGVAGQVASANAQQRAGVASGLGSLNGGALSYAGNYVNAGSNMMTNASSTAANFYNSSVNGMNNASQTFLDREKMGGDWILGANNAARDNVAFGADLNRVNLGTYSDGIGLLTSSVGAQNNDWLNATNTQVQTGLQGSNNVLTGQSLANQEAQMWFDQAVASKGWAAAMQEAEAKYASVPGVWQELAQYGLKKAVDVGTFAVGNTDWGSTLKGFGL